MCFFILGAQSECIMGMLCLFVQIYLPNHGETEIKFGVRNLYAKLWAVLYIVCICSI